MPRKPLKVRIGNLKVELKQHAVDLAFGLTVNKSQGSSYERVLAFLQSGTNRGRKLSYEQAYVMFSRVRNSDSFRCFPFQKSELHKIREHLMNLRPNRIVVKWLMDIGKDGYWEPRSGETPRGVTARPEVPKGIFPIVS